MTTGRHLVRASIAGECAERLAHKAEHLRVGNLAKEAVARGPVIDSGQRDQDPRPGDCERRRRCPPGGRGTYEDRFCRPTVLTDVTDASPAYAEEIFGPMGILMLTSSFHPVIGGAETYAFEIARGLASRRLYQARQVVNGEEGLGSAN